MIYISLNKAVDAPPIKKQEDLYESGKNRKLYDFTRPDVISKSQMREIWQVGEKLQTHVADKITFTTKPTSSWVSSVDELNNSEFLAAAPSNCFVYSYLFSEGGIAIEVDGNLGKAILKQDFKEYPEVTESDVKILNYLYYEKLFGSPFQNPL